MEKIPVFYTSCMIADSEAFSPSAGKPEFVVKSWEKKFRIQLLNVVPLTPKELMIAHEYKMVRNILKCRTPNGFGNRSEDVARTLPYTSGSMYQACLEALNNEEMACAPVSGFHHAGYSTPEGFCTFNGLMICARLVRKSHKIRTGILDIDAHYGNGTDDIIQHLKIDYVDHYTFGGDVRKNSAEGLNEILRDIPKIIEGMHANGCKLLMYQAGADPHINDPLGGFYTSEQLIERDRSVFETCKRLKLPVVWNLAGGYQTVPGEKDFAKSIQPVIDIHDATMAECCKVFLTSPKSALRNKRVKNSA